MEGPSNGSSVYPCNGQGPSGSTSSILIALCYGILIPMIVLGNGLVVAAFVVNPKLRTATNIFICGLGLSDLLIGMFSVPYWTYISTLNSLMDAYCTPLYSVYICVDIGTGCASILQLTSIAIERLYFTVAPLKHRRLPRSVYWYMLAVAWIFAIFAAGIQPLQNKSDWQDAYSIFLMVSCFVFPLFIIISVYLYILKVGRDQAKRKPSTSTRMGSTGGYIKEFNIFVTVIVITGVFVIAWAPFFVTTVIANFCPTCLSRPQSDHLVRFVKWMQYSSSAINPYIYAYRNEEVRASFKRILRVCCCSCLVEKMPIDKRRRYTTTLSQMHKRKSENISSCGNSFEEGRNVQNGHVAPEQFQQTLSFDDILLNTRPAMRKQTTRRELRPSGYPKRTLQPLTEEKPHNENKGFSGQQTQSRHSETKSTQENCKGRQKRNDQIERNEKILRHNKRRPGHDHSQAPRPHGELSTQHSNPIHYGQSTSRSKETRTHCVGKSKSLVSRSYENPIGTGDAEISYV